MTVFRWTVESTQDVVGDRTFEDKTGDLFQLVHVEPFHYLGLSEVGDPNAENIEGALGTMYEVGDMDKDVMLDLGKCEVCQ